MATEDDFAAFYRRSQYPESSAPDEGRDVNAGAMTSGSWLGVRSATKRLYEHLNRHYQHPRPFDVVEVGHQGTGRRGTTIVGYRPRRRSTGSRGAPIDPHFVQVLLKAALRIDANGLRRVVPAPVRPAVRLRSQVDGHGGRRHGRRRPGVAGPHTAAPRRADPQAPPRRALRQLRRAHALEPDHHACRAQLPRETGLLDAAMSGGASDAGTRRGPRRHLLG